MRFLLPTTLSWAVVLLATSSSRADTVSSPAEEPAPPRAVDRPGVSVGLRVGWGFPMGSLVTDDSLSSNFDGMLPVWLDVGYRFSKELYLGGYFQWGFGFISNDVCVAPLTSCSANDVRFGLNLHWHVKSAIGAGAWSEVVDPWLGIGTGYEIATFGLERGADTSHVSYRGWEFASLQLGADYIGLGSMRIGGFASFSVGEFTHTTVSVPTGAPSKEIPDPAVHEWLQLGIRGQYDF